MQLSQRTADIETAQRFNDLMALKSATGRRSSAILGGSLSYGAYYSVHGAPTPSDIDLLVVTPFFAHLPGLLRRLYFVPSISLADVKRAVDRASRIRFESTDVFSLRARMQPGRVTPYELSIHIVSRVGLALLLQEGKDISHYSDGTRITMRDHHAEAPAETHDTQCNFAGGRIDVPVSACTDGVGWSTSAGVCSIEAGRYHPGRLQNLVLPMFHVAWDALDIEPWVHRFRDRIAHRIDEELMSAPGHEARLSLAHRKKEKISPWLLPEIDAAL